MIVLKLIVQKDRITYNFRKFNNPISNYIDSLYDHLQIENQVWIYGIKYNKKINLNIDFINDLISKI